MLKIFVIIFVIIMLISFSIILRKTNNRINEEFSLRDNKKSISTTTSRTDSLEDSDLDVGGGSEE